MLETCRPTSARSIDQQHHVQGLSVVGHALAPGVTAKMFRTLAEEGRQHPDDHELEIRISVAIEGFTSSAPVRALNLWPGCGSPLDECV